MYEPKRNLIIAIFLVLVMEHDFVLANNNGEVVKCMETEREALLKFKEGLIDIYGMTSSWGKGKECCKWKGVRCSNTTGHVIGVKLHGNYLSFGYYLGGEINSALVKLHNLNALDLSGNDFGGNRFPEFICSMSQLRHLNLSWSNFSGTVPSHIGNLSNLRTLSLESNNFYGNVPLQHWNLTNLRTLSLSQNSFSGIIPPRIKNLVNLETLVLSVNSFSGIIPLQIGNLVNLETLDLSQNSFSGIVPPRIGNLVKLRTLRFSHNNFSTLTLEIEKLTNLETLDLSFNKFSGTVPPQIWGLTNLKHIDLSRNDLTSPTIDSIFNMSENHVGSSLTTLNLERNKLKRLPSVIWQFSKIEELKVSFNSLEEKISEVHLTKLLNLKVLYLSFNSLTLDISPDWTPPFNLSEIGLSGCKLGTHFPSWLQTQGNISTLDLSNNDISGEVPKWFWSLSDQVYYLNLSHNQLRGTIPDFSSVQLEYIDVSYNKFSGSIPLIPPSTRIFQISQNMFSGSLSLNCSISNNLEVLDLSSNQLEEKLPFCWENMASLLLLNLANNSFSGEIPHALGSLFQLKTLRLAYNNFSGVLPSTLKNCKQLQLIDIGDNMLTGRIPTWIGEYHDTMVYLIFRNNRFHGSIPPPICYLSSIQVLDLSGNSISGKIPPCFNNFTYFLHENISVSSGPLYVEAVNTVVEIIEYTIILWKRTESEYRRSFQLLKLIDLSRNRLVGNIPRSFGTLKELQSLNMSRNRLTGTIDPNIGQMISLEIIDLSRNHISGAIPISMTNLNFLSVLDLSGRIPIGTQLQTFHASAYSGNTGLCGVPLQPCPGDSPKSNPSTNKKAGNVDDGILSLPFLKEFGISIILGFIFGFWGVVGPLIVKESWRRIFYNFWSDVGDWMYVRVIILWKKLRRSNS